MKVKEALKKWSQDKKYQDWKKKYYAAKKRTMLNPNRYTNDVTPTSANQHQLNKVCDARAALLWKLDNAELKDRIIIEKLIDGLDAQIVEINLVNKLK